METSGGYMIVVTGANGQLGQDIIHQLLGKMRSEQIVASVRNPENASALKAMGISIRKGDFNNPNELRATFAQAEQVLLVSVNLLGAPALRLHEDAINAARLAGTGRILYTSHMGARADSPFLPAIDHAATETMLANVGTGFTSLRHGFYAESGMHMIGGSLSTGELRVPEDGPVSWTTRGDLAEADAIILTQEGRFNGISPPLTAPEAFTMADLAEIASQLTGREIKHVPLTDEQWLKETVAQGRPAYLAELLLGMYKASRRGDFATVDPTLEQLLGRRPVTMRDVLTANLLSSSE